MRPRYGAGRVPVTVSVARSRMLSDDAPTPMSKAPGSTADPIVPPWYQASCDAGSVNVTRVVSFGLQRDAAEGPQRANRLIGPLFS